MANLCLWLEPWPAPRSGQDEDARALLSSDPRSVGLQLLRPAHTLP